MTATSGSRATVIKVAFVVFTASATAAIAAISHKMFNKPDDYGFLLWRDSGTVARGRVLYKVNCGGCHEMPDGSPGSVNISDDEPAPRHDSRGHTWQHPDFALFQLVRDGVAVANCVPPDPNKMPKFRDVLTDAEIVSVLSYIKSTWPADILESNNTTNKMYDPYNHAVAKLIDPHKSQAAKYVQRAGSTKPQAR